MFLRPNSQRPPAHHSPRVADLLEQLEEARRDLWLATSPDYAANARADITKLKHDLWLCGYDIEEAV